MACLNGIMFMPGQTQYFLEDAYEFVVRGAADKECTQ